LRDLFGKECRADTVGMSRRTLRVSAASTRARLALVVLCLTGACDVSTAAQAASTQAPPVFRSSLDLVTIQVSVRDKRGRPIGDLQVSDFDVRDGGRTAPIVSMQFNRNSPVSVAVLVDMSGSMRLSTRMTLARRAFASLLTQLRPSVDEVGVFSFDSALHERRPFTSDLDTVADALDDCAPFGTTSLHDAVAATARRLSARTAIHKAIVVVTDGLDTSSSLSAQAVAAVASSIDVPVYVVATVGAGEQRAIAEALRRPSASEAGDLRDLAEWTGGTLLFASGEADSVAAARHFISELRQQYVLAIEAGAVDEWRRLDVRVKRPAALVKARSGYFGG